MHLFEYDIIDNPFILENKNGQVIICNEAQPNVVQEVKSPFDGSYTELLRENGSFCVSKRGYKLYGNLVSLDEKSRLKSRIEGSNVIGTTRPYQCKGKMYQVIELWLTKDDKLVDIVQYLYKRDTVDVDKATMKNDNKKTTINNTQKESIDNKPTQYTNTKRRKK